MRTAFLVPALALFVMAAGLVGEAAGTFSDETSVSDNTFSTASCFLTWWNPDYLYRRQITVTTGVAGVDSGYSAEVVLNHASLVGAGKSQPDGDDVRVLYWDPDGCVWSEPDRALDEDSDWGSSSTKIWFKVQAEIPASSSDGDYYLYYGNATATNPPADKSNVYLYWDDFESYATGSAPTGWTVISGNHQVVDDAGNKLLRSTGSTSGRHAIYRNGIAEADIRVSSRVRTNDVTNTNMGPSTRVTGTIESNSNYYTYHFRRTDNADHLAKVVNGTWSSVVSTAQTVNNGTWYRYDIGTAGSSLRGWISSSEQLSTTDTSISGPGSVGLYKVFGSADGADTIDADNFIARLYVYPEPTTSLDVEQPKP